MCNRQFYLCVCVCVSELREKEKREFAAEYEALMKDHEASEIEMNKIGSDLREQITAYETNNAIVLKEKDKVIGILNSQLQELIISKKYV